METMRRVFLKIEHLSHFFGERCVLHDVNLEVAEGQFVGLIGPSGCGKSTLLRAIVGTHLPTKGRTLVYSRSQGCLKEVTEPSRDIGIVYQGYPLFRYLTALRNVAYGLKLDETTIPQRILRWFPFYIRRRGKRISWAKLRKIHLQEAREWLKKLGINDEAMGKYPVQLSGGMQQRVAIAQALIMKPKILLMDEPFSALDQETKEEILGILEALYEENIQAVKDGQEPPYTIIVVTHELSAAILVGDRVIGLSPWWDYTKESDPSAKGASSVIYDKASKVFLPDKYKMAREFASQEEEVKEVVISNKTLQLRNENVLFWKQAKEGDVVGVLKVLQEKEQKQTADAMKIASEPGKGVV
jgi:NitT/TauT family transport system ATP-binding protein